MALNRGPNAATTAVAQGLVLGAPSAKMGRSVRSFIFIAGLASTVAIAALPAFARPSLLDAPPEERAFTLDAPDHADHPAVDLLLAFRDASIERLGPLRVYTLGRYGRWKNAPWFELAWGDEHAGLEPQPLGDDSSVTLDERSLDIVGDRDWLKLFDPVRPPIFDSTGPSLETDGFGNVFRLPPVKPIVDWRCRRRPVTFVRYGAENDRFDLVRCDGSTAPFALDRLSVLARPPEAARPTDGLLPDEPDEAAWNLHHEWVDGVRIMHPRLLWALQKLSDAFPWKAVYIYSGYRPLAEVHDGSGHMSLHAMGRAIDISFYGVSNEDLFKACRDLPDVGCGFYPHAPFVHVDVRRAHSGQAFWVDDSAPGEPAHYVDGWPGVVENGALSWVPAGQR